MQLLVKVKIYAVKNMRPQLLVKFAYIVLTKCQK